MPIEIVKILNQRHQALSKDGTTTRRREANNNKTYQVQEVQEELQINQDSLKENLLREQQKPLLKREAAQTLHELTTIIPLSETQNKV
jgi:hypothetical protein